jgi:hypothetical protein
MHVRLKEVVSCLKMGQWVQFLREICPLKNDPKSGAVNSTITRILLIELTSWPPRCCCYLNSYSVLRAFVSTHSIDFINSKILILTVVYTIICCTPILYYYSLFSIDCLIELTPWPPRCCCYLNSYSVLRAFVSTHSIDFSNSKILILTVVHTIICCTPILLLFSLSSYLFY